MIAAVIFARSRSPKNGLFCHVPMMRGALRRGKLRIPLKWGTDSGKVRGVFVGAAGMKPVDHWQMTS